MENRNNYIFISLCLHKEIQKKIHRKTNENCYLWVGGVRILCVYFYTYFILVPFNAILIFESMQTYNILKANSGGKGVAEVGSDLDRVSSKDVENDLTLDGGDGCTTL